MAASGQMKASEYRNLCRQIFQRYRKPLKLIYVDACEMADDVLWGRMTRERLFGLLDKAVDEQQGY